MPTLRLSGAVLDAGDGALAAEEDERVDDLWADGGSRDGDADGLGELAEAERRLRRSPPISSHQAQVFFLHTSGNSSPSQTPVNGTRSNE